MVYRRTAQVTGGNTPGGNVDPHAPPAGGGNPPGSGAAIPTPLPENVVRLRIGPDTRECLEIKQYALSSAALELSAVSIDTQAGALDAVQNSVNRVSEIWGNWELCTIVWSIPSEISRPPRKISCKNCGASWQCRTDYGMMSFSSEAVINCFPREIQKKFTVRQCRHPHSEFDFTYELIVCPQCTMWSVFRLLPAVVLLRLEIFPAVSILRFHCRRWRRGPVQSAGNPAQFLLRRSGCGINVSKSASGNLPDALFYCMKL